MAYGIDVPEVTSKSVAAKDLTEIPPPTPKDEFNEGM